MLLMGMFLQQLCIIWYSCGHSTSLNHEWAQPNVNKWMCTWVLPLVDNLY